VAGNDDVIPVAGQAAADENYAAFRGAMVIWLLMLRRVVVGRAVID
jgi:hypothetical protein